ncbi:MAG: DUF4248 domain-containing protein [Bacteroidales bacterium]|nr:DUF4248 domain-containing protein [Bacteroidales bacterium]
MNSTFSPAPIRAYGKAELAHLYYGLPVSDNRACSWFAQQMRLHPQLMRRLADMGYSTRCRVFSPQQVRAIFEAMGWPEVVGSR